MKQAIAVTQRLIDEPGMGCPVSVALHSEYPGALAGYNNLWLDKTGANRFYTIAPEVREWLHRYDHYEPVEPFILVLDHKARTAEMLTEVTA